MKKVVLFMVSFVLFSCLISYLGNYFFWWQESFKIHIEPLVNNQIVEEVMEKSIEKHSEVELESAQEDLTYNPYSIRFFYNPNNLSTKTQKYVKSYKNFLNDKDIENKYENIDVHMYENMKIKMVNGEEEKIRWNMHNKSVHLFWVEEMSIMEYTAVWIHELAHYIDLYYLERSLFTDVSNYFYEISWDSAKIMKAWQDKPDFVSWYAMTNKYEDFAESFTYYILHNKDFENKAQKSDILKEKYDFFTKYLFKNKRFIGTDFSEEKIRSYYRDTTIIKYSREKFEEFLTEK